MDFHIVENRMRFQKIYRKKMFYFELFAGNPKRKNNQ